MGLVLPRRHCSNHRLSSVFAAFTLLFLIPVSAICLTSFGGGFEQQGEEASGSGFPGRVIEAKRFAEPGSSPPSCRSKCGTCAPCEAVHVPVQTGFSTPLEYYPEAWRCKCGNKLFMP